MIIVIIIVIIIIIIEYLPRITFQYKGLLSMGSCWLRIKKLINKNYWDNNYSVYKIRYILRQKYTKLKTILCGMIGMEIVLPNRASTRNVDKVKSGFSFRL